MHQNKSPKTFLKDLCRSCPFASLSVIAVVLLIVKYTLLTWKHEPWVPRGRVAARRAIFTSPASTLVQVHSKHVVFNNITDLASALHVFGCQCRLGRLTKVTNLTRLQTTPHNEDK